MKWAWLMIELESMAIAMPEVVGHPNREAFCGVLTLVDVPSQRAPSGARGHQVVLTRAGRGSGVAFAAGDGAGLCAIVWTGTMCSAKWA